MAEFRTWRGNPGMIEFGQDICTDLNAACRREWLETNGLGGFASSTIIGLNSRRYHGLLTAATNPPVGRLLLLSKLEETLILDGQHFELSANQYPGVIHPQGYRYLTGFRLDPFPVFTYGVGGLKIEKAVYMIQGENSTVIEYTLKGQSHTAFLKVNGSSTAARQQAATWIKAWCAHLHDAGLGIISEIFDGDAPHQPRGCIAQAWSVPELLQGAVEDVLGRRPATAR